MPVITIKRTLRLRIISSMTIPNNRRLSIIIIAIVIQNAAISLCMPNIPVIATRMVFFIISSGDLSIVKSIIMDVSKYWNSDQK